VIECSENQSQTMRKICTDSSRHCSSAACVVPSVGWTQATVRQAARRQMKHCHLHVERVRREMLVLGRSGLGCACWCFDLCRQGRQTGG
jgi:hypothetical protein